VLYIEDGNIKGEFVLGKYVEEITFKERERKLNNWLMEMGW
jgi:putative ABC transport system ATP-binding protein